MYETTTSVSVIGIIIVTLNFHSYAVDVALDWINNRLYYTDSIGDEIEVYDLNNDTYWTILSRTSELPLDPSTIAVDPLNK